MVETDVVEGLMERATHKEIMVAMLKMEFGKAIEPSELGVAMIVASGKIRIKVVMGLCQHILDGGGMPDEWKASVISCGSHREERVLKHVMKIFEWVLKR